ncbi:potassium channel protein [Desertifilum sp. FACHB-1129]|uniref:Potassium channel protein n=1 Tax=Desertifilum tharense IPPAS B-1220 TaxID=1781255 RepID=A0A1E5QKF5_9CYAN|nr:MULTISPECIES: potassium channel protein [Desertifilum]MDA0209750.1 potassium channel protein [Cyanobacteria bacterium FC1]MBD2310759.1 potassium channel protein [Desertifilum sp. FACHB-1129]MBD2320796.1 potassium channel protein [Desertifilum sp. FACHB-866]MBD2330924.1 potassium channel protein [Desertifilum sp. FACHB-868]OEJ75176.1 potassium channel protein [Desertifilum tharense IPPAS B-1220]
MSPKTSLPNQVNLERQYRRLRAELLGGAIALAGVFLTGTLWYKFVEGWRTIDAIYMTAITLATVGYLEVQPMNDRARIFTIVLLLMGVVAIGYIVNRFTEAVIQGYFQEERRIRLQKRLIESLSEHYILCGFGRTGRQVALEFQAENISFVVIDSELDPVQTAQSLGCVAFQGDATLDQTLIQVGIERALCLVAALPSDAENLYAVLSAKTLNPKIRAIARASTEEAVQKLQRGGADAVVSPYITGGRRMAAAALRPQVMDFLEGAITGADRAYYLEEFLIDPQLCPFVGQSLSEARLRSQTGALVLAIRRDDGTLIGGPMGETQILPGDLLICMGTAEQLRSLNRLLGPLSSRLPRPPRKNTSQ